jgi:DNA-binding transcriptional LysR family regulator
MELRAIRSLLLLAKHGSITGAATAQDVSPAAIHKQLKALEEELGLRVYERMGNRLALTPEGSTLLPYFETMAEQHEAALHTVEELKGMRHGAVRLSGGLSISKYLLPGLLKRFRQRYPQIDLQVESGNILAVVEELRKGAVDLAFMASGDLLGSMTDMVVEISWKYEFVTVSSRQWPHRKCSLKELENEPFILYPRGFLLLERYLDNIGLNPRVIMRFDSADAIKAMVQHGLGMSILPIWTVNDVLRRGAVHRVEHREPPLETDVVLVRRQASYVPKAVRAFIDLARQIGFGRVRMHL